MTIFFNIDNLTGLFLKLLNASYVACYVIVATLLLRMLIKRAPKIFSYCLWLVVLFRLLCPVSFESALSPLPSARLIEPQSLNGVRPVVTSGFTAVDQPVNTYLQTTYFEGVTRPVGHGKQIAAGLALIWLSGVVLLAAKSARDVHRLRRYLRSAQPLQDNVWQTPGLPTAFVLGLLRPRVYLPAGLSPEEQGYILLHEQTHLRRQDHLWKLLAHAALLLHWFNPLVWLAFRLGVQDMETSCDEAVLRRLGPTVRPDYAASLLRLATGAGWSLPLAFGEGGVKQRVKNVLAYRRPTLWVCLIALLAVVAGGLWLAANPAARALSPAEKDQAIREQAEAYMEMQINVAAAGTGLQIAETRLDDLYLIHDFEFPGTPLTAHVWQLNYRLRPADPDDIPLIDYTLDDAGWIDWSYDLCRHTLVFIETADSPQSGPQILCELSPLDFNESVASLENAVRLQLEQLGQIPPETFPGEHVIVQFPLSDGEVCQLLLSKPAAPDHTGIWCVERWAQGNGNLYLVEPPVTDITAVLTLADYYLQLQNQCDDGHQPWRLYPEEVAVDFIMKQLGQTNLRREDLTIIQPATWQDFTKLPNSHYFGYIANFDPANITGRGNIYFHFDSAEMITDADTQRIAELNLDPDRDMPGGFYIHNPATYPLYFEADFNTSYTYGHNHGDEYPKTTTDPAEFAAYLSGFAPGAAPPFHITTSLGVATEITEQYIP